MDGGGRHVAGPHLHCRRAHVRRMLRQVVEVQYRAVQHVLLVMHRRIRRTNTLRQRHQMTRWRERMSCTVRGCRVVNMVMVVMVA